MLPMFTHEGWEYDGPYFKFPLRNVLPKPVQKPHPPLWVACSQLETIELAGRCGIGALGFQFLSAEMAHAWVHAYYNSFVKRQQKLADYQSNCNIAMVSYFMCAETDEEARRRADGVTFFQFSLAYYSGSRNRERAAPGTVNLWDEYLKWKLENPENAERALRGGLIGSPETIRRKLHRFAEFERGQHHPAQSGRAESARAYLRKPRAVRQGGDAASSMPWSRSIRPGSRRC